MHTSRYTRECPLAKNRYETKADQRAASDENHKAKLETDITKLNIPKPIQERVGKKLCALSLLPIHHGLVHHDL